jgi:hypothetical protein
MGPEVQGSLMYQTRTDSAGLAEAFWRLGSDAGCGNNRCEVTSKDIVGTTIFCATATPEARSNQHWLGQQSVCGSQFASPIATRGPPVHLSQLKNVSDLAELAMAYGVRNFLREIFSGPHNRQR